LQPLAFERAGRGCDPRRPNQARGRGFEPVACISLVPRGSGAEVPFIWSRKSKVARLQTNSFVSSTKATESFGPSLENITIGGLSVMPLKNE
jgi:hypothetical protein